MADVPALLSLVDHLQEEVDTLREERRRLLEEHQLLSEQVRLAGQVQRDLLPEPNVFPGLEMGTLYRPAHRVSGDMYDIKRLDESNVGISLADASGHGVSAALFTVLLKRSFHGKEIIEGSYRVLGPAEVLARVNRDIFAVALKQCQFVTGSHAVYREPDRTLTFARGGMPYPILLRNGQPPKQLISEGPIIGAFSDAYFETMTVHLEPGDGMLFYTDGLEALLLDRTGPAPFDDIAQTPWYAALSSESLFAAFEGVVERVAASPGGWPPDDLTAIALRVTG